MNESNETAVTLRTTASNAALLTAIFHTMPENGHIAICEKHGDPDKGGWQATKYSPDHSFDHGRNNYLNCASFYQDDQGHLAAKIENFAGLHVIVLDDVGTKILWEKLDGLQPTAKIETSPGNFQVLFILAQPILDSDAAKAFQKRFIDAGLCDPGASGACRWVRLPDGINGKPKYFKDGKAFQCSLVEFNPEVRHAKADLETLIDQLTIQKKALEPSMPTLGEDKPSQDNAIYSPKPKQNPVVAALIAKGLYKRSTAKGIHDITCPRLHEHTGGVDNGTAYFEPSEQYPIGGFKCHHSHGNEFSISCLLKDLGIDPVAARFQPVIRIQNGELHSIVDAVCLVLAEIDNIFQMGNLLVKIERGRGRYPKVVVINPSELTLLLSQYIYWLKFDRRSMKWERNDPLIKAVTTIYDSKQLKHVKQLKRVAMQAFYREQTGVLVLKSGYDAESQIFGTFDACKYQLPEPTLENAQKSLAALKQLLREFAFATDLDMAVALSMLFTAVTRPSLNLAPAYHVKAAMSGSGKSYLCALAGAFASPYDRQTAPYPRTDEEAKKVLLSLLLESLSVIEFDDLDGDIKPYSIIKQALTSEYITDRILGQSKTATVSTRTLFLFSGNNVGPVRDLLRRILTINLVRPEENATQVVYESNPVQIVEQNRELYIGHVLTIIEAWKHAGSPKTTPINVLTYGGSWSDYCRHPLIWLGLEDPGKALVEQVSHDPDIEALGNLLRELHLAYKSELVTVRKIKNNLCETPDLLDALEDCPVSNHKGIDSNLLGWYFKKSMNRAVGGVKLLRGYADGRTAWQVVPTTPIASESEVAPSVQPEQIPLIDEDADF